VRDFAYTLKAGFVLFFALIFAAGALSVSSNLPTGNLFVDFFLWALLLGGAIRGAIALAVHLRRRRFGDEPPADPPSLTDVMMYSGMFLFAPVLLAMFAKDAFHPGEHRNFAVGISVVCVFMILAPIAALRRYVIRR
jgi:hypothetical protein